MQPQFPTFTPTFASGPVVQPFERGIPQPAQQQPAQLIPRGTIVTTPGPVKNNNSQPVKTTQKPQPQPQNNQPKPSLIHQVGSFLNNNVVKPTETGFKDAGTGIARILPGGTNDIKAQAAGVDQANKNIQFINALKQQGKISAPAAAKIIESNAQGASQADAQLNQTVKSMPTTKQFAGGLLTVGTFMLPGAGEAEKGAPLLTRLGYNALRGAGAGALFGAGGALQQNGSASDVAKAAALNAIVGGALGGGGTAVGAGLRKIVNGRVPLDEAGALGGSKTPDLSKGDAQQIIDSMTKESQTRPLSNDEQALLNHAQNQLKLNQLAERNSGGTAGSAALQHADAVNNYTFSKSPYATASDIAKARSSMTKLEGMDHPNLKPLDERGSVQVPNFGKGNKADFKATGGPKISLTESDLKQAAQDSLLSNEEKANLPADRQMKLDQFENGKPASNKQLGAKKLAQADAANPVKVSIPSVNPADENRFAHARALPQMASNPIKVATKVASYSAKDAGLSVSDLADRVEHPEDYTKMSPKEQTAVNDWKYLTNLVNATSHQLGGKEARLDNFFKHAVDTSQWAGDGEKPLFEAKTGKLADAKDFKGIDAISRKTDEATGKFKYPDLRSLHDAGFKLKHEDNVENFINNYGGAAAYRAEKQAFVKAFSEADGGAEAGAKTRSFDLRDGKPLNLSPEAYKEARGYLRNESSLLGKIYDKPTSATKHILLSMSQYHPTNVNALQAAPSLALQGHPIMAGKGLVDTVRTAVDKGYSNDLARQDLQSGIVHKSAQIGAPMYKTDFSTNGETSKMGQMVFGRQIPAMQRQVNAAVIKDLESKGVDLNSKAARDAGEVANNTMGFFNAQAKNLDPRVMRGFSRFLLAPQFEMSKLNIVAKALDPRTSALARRNALTAIFGKYGAEVGLALGVGTALHQKSDSTKDVLIREAVNPSIPTPLKDSKGNTIKFKLPDSGASELVNLATGVNRGNDGRLHVTLNNPQQAGSEIVNDVRGKTAPLPGAVTKVATNENYAGKPLYQKNAPAGTKAEQAAATLITDELPIGTQGAVYTKPVLDHVPGNVRAVLENNKPGTNPLFKSGLTTVAATPQTDQTVGKGLQTKQYFDAKDAATKGLNANDLAAFNSIHQETKDPVTGQYIIKPTVFDSEAKATLYQQHPNVLAADTKLNQQLQKNGQKVDPFFNLNPAQQKAYLAYETMQPLSADRADWLNKNNSWYKDFATNQSNYFNSLPAADPNRPTAPIKYPTPTAGVQSQMDQYNAINQTDTAARTQFLNNHPDVVNQFADQTRYDNAIRVARGYAAVKQSPNAPADLQKYMDNYNAADKATRTQLRNSNPQLYQRMVGFYDTLDLSTIAKESGVNQLAGEPDTSNKELKAISSVAGDIYTNKGVNPTNPTYTIIPAGWLGGVPNGYSAASSGGSGYSSNNSNPVFHAPTSGTNEFGKLNSIIKASVKLPKAGSVKYYKSSKPGRVGKIKSNNIKGGVKPPKFPRPSAGHVTKRGVILTV